MPTLRIQRSSWLRKSSLVEDQVGDTFFVHWSRFDAPVIEESDEDIIHVVKVQDRLDRLAYEYYRNSRLWWVIAQANDIDNPTTGIQVGQELTIPSPDYVLERLAR